MTGDPGSPTGGGLGVGEQNFLQRMLHLTQAATNAATAAQTALERLNAPSLNSASAAGPDVVQQGLSAASRIFKSPEAHTGEDARGFSVWKFRFTNWLTFGENKLQSLLERAEEMSGDITMLSADEDVLSSKLYSILVSYLRGRCTQLVRAGMRERNGLQLWRDLHRECMPNTRQRGLALAQALATYPPFNPQKSILESILEYEQLIVDFEKVSSSKYPEELKSATLLRCTEQRVREFLQLSVTDPTSYSDIRETLLAHEKVTKTWSQEAVMKSIQPHSNAVPGGGKPLDPNGPAPTDVDRGERGFAKGKGEQEGKFRGKGEGFWGVGAFGTPSGRGRGGNGYQKGRGKKGKGKSKGGSTGKKGKGKVDQNQCRVCYEYSHWSNECPRRHVNQVQQQTPVPPNVHFGSTGANQAPTYQQSSATATVRRIFNLGASLTSNLSSSNSSYVRAIIEEVDEQQQHEIGQKCLGILD